MPRLDKKFIHGRQGRRGHKPCRKFVSPGAPLADSAQRQSALVNQVTLLLAEKRTSLSVMRTGLAVLALPISVLSVLIVISRYYDPLKVVYLLGPLLGLCLILTAVGSYLVIKALRRITRFNKMLQALKKQDSELLSAEKTAL